MNIATKIPPKIRKAIYAVLGVVAAVELALDGVGWGLIPDEPQGKALSVLAALGFYIAVSNTDTHPQEG
jgi:hypothetical protein